jgi:predicted phage terminase large subunit-like protein
VPARQFARTGDSIADLTAYIETLGPDDQADLVAFTRTLSPEHVAVVESIMADKLGTTWRADPAAMAAFLDPTYRRPPYVRLLARKFREGVDGTSPRQVWNLPARYGKSLGAIWGVTWALDRSEGTARSIVVSYGQELADEIADGIRERLRAHSDVLRAQLRPDRQAVHRYVTTQGGGVHSAGLDSAITGFGVNRGGVLLVDDPFKNWQAAHSEAQRNLVWNTFRGTLRNRLDDEQAFILVIHHRVHEDDLTARLVAQQAIEDDEFGDQWDVTVLPALAVVGDPLGREVGEPLDPDRFPYAAVRSRAAGLGSYLSSALEQQDPTPEEGTDILRAWFRLESTRPTAPDDTLTSWDLKLKDKEMGDFVVGQCWWRVAGGYWLVDQIRGQFDHATTANAIALMAVRHPDVIRHVVEAAGAYDEVMPMLRQADPDYTVTEAMASRLGMNEQERADVEALRRRGMSGLVAHPVKGDKRVRARTHIVPNAEAGDIHLPAEAAWLPVLLDELAAFPNGVHDDQVDAMSQALQRLDRSLAAVSRPTGVMPSLRPSGRRGGGFGAGVRPRRASGFPPQ